MKPFLILQHVPHEHLGILRQGFESHSIPLQTVHLDRGEMPPHSLSDVSGLVLLGGPMNVYEETEYPYLRAEDRLLKEAIAEDLPTLGICLGAQLIAKAAGASVRKGGQKEIGWYPLGLTWAAQEDPLFLELPKEIPVFQWHGDTFDIPSGGVRLAGSKLFANQAFRLGRRVYGLQFHLEVTAEMITSWIHENREELRSLRGTIDPARILDETSGYLPLLHQHARMFFRRFLSYCLR